MGNVWREYGVIAVLLVVAVGGYLLLSRSDEDLVGRALETVSEQLLALVPDGSEKEEARVTLAALEARMADREVSPEQMERLAASVLNLHSSGTSIGAEDAEMVVRMAMEDSDVLPAVAGLPTPAAPPMPPKPRATEADLAAAAGRVERMFEFFSEVTSVAPVEGAGPAMRFYADDGLKAVVDERLRDRVRPDRRLESETERRMVAWQSRLAESVQADRERLEGEAEAFGQISLAIGDSLRSTADRFRKLAMLRRLESKGFVIQPAMESLAVSLERELITEIAPLANGQAEMIETAIGTALDAAIIAIGRGRDATRASSPAAASSGASNR